MSSLSPLIIALRQQSIPILISILFIQKSSVPEWSIKPLGPKNNIFDIIVVSPLHNACPERIGSL